jgi:hypothetical protein
MTVDNVRRSPVLWQLIALLLLALPLRLWHIGVLPPGFHFDEAFEGLEAWRIVTDPSYRPLFLIGNFGVPPLNSYVNALTFALWQGAGLTVGPTAMRVTAAILGVLGVLSLFALAHELRQPCFGFRARSAAFPWLAAAVLATMRWHIHFSRMGIEPILVPLVWSTATWLFLRGWRTGQLPAFVGSGVVLATGMYAYQGAWVIPLLLAATALLLLSGRRHQAARADYPMPTLRRRLAGAVLAGAVAALLFAPLAWFFLQNIELVFLRPAQLSIVGETSSSADSSITTSLWATAKMFGPFGMPGDMDPRRNLPGAPALSVVYALLFYLGLVLTIRQLRRPAAAIVLLGLLGLLLPGIVSEYAPHFHRILGAAAPTALLCAVGLDWLWQWRVHRLSIGDAWVGRAVVITLLVLGTVREAQNYFVRWAALPDLFYAFDVGLWRLGQEIAALPAESPVYLTPRSADHATLAFAWQTWPQARPVPITFDGRQIFPLTAGSNAQAEYYAVIEHEDFRTRLLLPSLFPTATVTTELVDATGGVYGRFYQRPTGTTSTRTPQIYLHEDKSALPLGDGIALVGADLQPQPAQRNQPLYVQLYWQTTAPPQKEWTVFVHLLQPTAEGGWSLVAGHDRPPGGGSLPTTRWQSGWQVLDEHQLPLPGDLAPGQYWVAVGLYNGEGDHLPVAAAGAVERILLGEIAVE